MRRITHGVDHEKVRDLLERVPRACVAFNSAGTVELAPVEFRFQEGCYWIGMPGGGSGPLPGRDERVKLLIDEGMHYFDIRGIWVRGRALFGEGRPQGGSPALSWFQLVPEKVLAWDFGAMREVRSQ